jgi:hypothetical protein
MNDALCSAAVRTTGENVATDRQVGWLLAPRDTRLHPPLSTACFLQQDTASSPQNTAPAAPLPAHTQPPRPPPNHRR